MEQVLTGLGQTLQGQALGSATPMLAAKGLSLRWQGVLGEGVASNYEMLPGQATDLGGHQALLGEQCLVKRQATFSKD